MQRIVDFFSTLKTHHFVMAGLFVAMVLHGWNMYGYPYYEGDEGIYTAQAWSVVREGTLNPYVYWYDHPPFGWFAMAGWAQLFGGNFFVFGESSIDNMRFLMFLFHMMSSGLVFYIAKRISKNNIVAFAAVVLFSLSPLLIYYQRRVLLDNIMTFWVLGATALLFARNMSLKKCFLSGLLFGVAILTKIPAVLFGCGFLALLWVRKAPAPLYARVAVWGIAALIVLGAYFGTIHAKGELFLTEGKASFMSGIQFQTDRAEGSPLPWKEGSYFRNALSDWILHDRLIIYLSTLAILSGFFFVRKSKWMIVLLAFVVPFVLFMMRGGYITHFHVLPVAPFIMILIPFVLHRIGSGLMSPWVRRIFYVVIVVVLAVYYIFFARTAQFFEDHTVRNNASVAWIEENVSEDAFIVADIQHLVDLWDTGEKGERRYRNAEWFWKVNDDGRIAGPTGKLKEDFRNMDYILLSHELLKQIEGMPADKLVRQAYDHRELVEDWSIGAYSGVDEATYESSFGDWAKLYAVSRSRVGAEKLQWSSYKQNYIKDYGRVSDAEGNTTSEMQGHAMMRAVWADDREAFDGLWQWTQDHLRHRVQDRLFFSAYANGNATNPDNDTYADETIAAALAFAHEKWSGDVYRLDAREVIVSIWNQAVRQINGRYTVLPREAGFVIRDDGYALAPHVLTPAWYEMFAKIDLDHPWRDVIRDSYALLGDIVELPGNTTGLIPDALWIHQKTGELRYALDPLEADGVFGLEAYRTLWNAAIDALWFNRAEARDFLARINAERIPRYERDQFLPSIVTVSDEVVDGRSNIRMGTGYFAAMMTSENKETRDKYFRWQVQEIYTTKKDEEDASRVLLDTWYWYAKALHDGYFAFPFPIEEDANSVSSLTGPTREK